MVADLLVAFVIKYFTEKEIFLLHLLVFASVWWARKYLNEETRSYSGMRDALGILLQEPSNKDLFTCLLAYLFI